MKMDQDFIDMIEASCNVFALAVAESCINAVKSGDDSDMQEARLAIARHESRSSMRKPILNYTEMLLGRIDKSNNQQDQTPKGGSIKPS